MQRASSPSVDDMDFGYEPAAASNRVTDAEINDMLKRLTALSFSCEDYEMIPSEYDSC